MERTTTTPYSRMTPMQVAQMVRHLNRAVKLAGTWEELARLVSAESGHRITAQGAYAWSIKGLPAERAVEIEHALDGQVTRQQLRPDLYVGMALKPAK